MVVSGLRFGLRRIADAIDRATRYDFVLGIIPAAFLTAAVLRELSVLSTRTAVLFGGLIGGLAVVDALFLNPPEAPTTGGPSA
ncbi:MAG: hypothetical protein ABEH59_09200 [Halobacteriales archaeon]